MYIESFWCGVIAIAIRTNLDDKEDETNEE